MEASQIYCSLLDISGVEQTLANLTHEFKFSPFSSSSKNTSPSPTHPLTHAVGYNDEQWRERGTSQCRTSLVRSRDAELVAGTNKLTRDSSVKEELRKYLRPIKKDDPRLDFYTTYKEETTEYDANSMEMYNEDLNNTLIFVRFFDDSVAMQPLTTFAGRSILRGHHRLRH